VLVKNLLANIANTALNFLIPLITLPYTARVLGPEGLGIVGFAFSVAGTFLMFSGVIGTVYGTREIAKARANTQDLQRVFSEMFFLNVFAQTIVLIGYMGTIFLVPRFQSDLPYFLIAGLLFVGVGLNVDWYYQGIEDFGTLFKRNLLGKIVSLVFLFLFVTSKTDTLAFAFVSVTALLVGNAWAWIGALRRVSLTTKGLNFSRHPKALGVFYIINLLIVVSANVDKMILGLLGGTEVLGLYSLADKVVLLGVSITASLTMVLLPRVSEAHAQDRGKEFSDTLLVAWKFLGLLALPLWVGTFFMAPEIVFLLGGQEFLGTVGSLRVLSLNLVIVALAGILGIQVLSARGKERFYAVSLLGSNVTLIFLSVVLVPIFQSLGTALAMVSANLVQTGIQSFFGRDHLVPLLRNSENWKFGVALAVLGSMTFGIRSLMVSLGFYPIVVFLGVSGLGALVFGLVLYALRESFLLRVLSVLRVKKS